MLSRWARRYQTFVTQSTQSYRRREREPIKAPAAHVQCDQSAGQLARLSRGERRRENEIVVRDKKGMDEKKGFDVNRGDRYVGRHQAGFGFVYAAMLSTMLEPSGRATLKWTVRRRLLIIMHTRRSKATLSP